jgi:tetratricopeptide (TPR) repeat protein
MGSVECWAQSATADTWSPVILPSKTSVILHLTKSLYRKDAKPGQPVEFEAGYDIFVTGQIVIKSGTAVTGIFRGVDHTVKGPAKVLIDLGPVQTVSGEMVRLAWTGSTTATRSEGGMGVIGALGFVDNPIAIPIVLPALVGAKLFEKREKKVLLNKDAGAGWLWWGEGVWVVAHVAENVPLDPAKQKAAQEQYITNRRAEQAELCKLLAQGNLDSQNRDWERFAPLAGDLKGLFGPNKADLLRSAGDLDGAIEEQQRVLVSAQDLPCSAKYAGLSSGELLFLALTNYLPEKREQLLKSSASDSHLELAGLYREKRDFVHAISECRTAMQLDPENERTRIGLIDSLEDSGDLDAAIAESKEAIRLWPERPYFHYLLGRLLVKKNEPDAAIVELQWVLKEERNHDWKASCAIGRAFELKGDLKAALRHYRTAFRAHGDDKECHAAYERLQLRVKNESPTAER